MKDRGLFLIFIVNGADGRCLVLPRCRFNNQQRTVESCDLFIVRNIRITKAIQPSDVIRYYPYVVIPYHRRTVMFTSTEHLLMDGQRKWTARSNGSEIQHYL